MKILAIETSCDETAVSLIDASGDFANAAITVRGNALFSQVDLHAKYGGVYPNLAKREHSRKLVPLLDTVLTQAFGTQEKSEWQIANDTAQKVEKMLEREPELFEQLQLFLTHHTEPNIDAIAVTYGPGLEPALWVGINFAQALALLWDIPVIPIDHMEGHIFSALLKKELRMTNESGKESYHIARFGFPVLVLLISGGHTELILMKDWFSYEILGQTRDDAVGEAFDKVARMLDLPYPGGPEISKLADSARKKNIELDESLPRPMINSNDYDFSFSGLKTAVLYRLQLDEHVSKEAYARAFEDAVVDIFIKKVSDAIDETGAQTLILGGGVSANNRIQSAFKALQKKQYPDMVLCIPKPALTGDNAVMIGTAGYFRIRHKKISNQKPLRAEGSLMLQ